MQKYLLKIIKSKVHTQKRIKLWKLKDPTLRERYEQSLAGYMVNTEGTLNDLKSGIERAEAETCGTTSGKRGWQRETWWWNPAVQGAIQDKRLAFKV